MAGDWIKVEHPLPDKQEVAAMSALLSIDHDAVVGKLVRVWVWADQNSVSGTGLIITSSFLDRLALCPGFAAAMRKVGWLEGRDGALSFPRFDRHNGQTAKSRAESNRRMAKTRDTRARVSCGNVAENAQQKPQPEREKRREEGEKNSAQREEGDLSDPPGTEPAVDKWIAYLATFSVPEWYARQKHAIYNAKGWAMGKTPMVWKKTGAMVKADFVNDGGSQKPPNGTSTIPAAKDTPDPAGWAAWVKGRGLEYSPHCRALETWKNAFAKEAKL